MSKFRVLPVVYTLLIAVLALGALGATPTPVKAQEGSTILDVALAANAETGEFSILVAALQAANPNLLQRLGSQDEYTVFAPTDAAFTALLDELGITAEELLSDRKLVSRVLRYHIARGRLDSSEVLARKSIRTLQGRFFQANGVLIDVNDRTANIVTPDIQASNGVIHVIDRVLLPKVRGYSMGDTILDVVMASNDETGEFSILIAALEAANPNLLQRLESRREYTVLAPTDAAFAALLEELGITAEQLLSNQALVSRVLRYHIIRDELDSAEVLASERIETLQGGPIFQSGGVLTDVNGRTANIVTTDIQASNGIIHVIDRVLLPETRQVDLGETILDVAMTANEETGEFSILIAALEAAEPNILERLDSRREHTVFAPTDAAFAALLEELGVTAEQLLSNQALVSRVLRYHIVRGELGSTEVLSRERINTLQGRLFQANGVLTDANGRTANIVATDIQASNGIIHVIDRVVLPR